jgi:hypothetical protein
MTIADAKRISITDWLASHGYQPSYKRGDNWWYLSMLPNRTEHTPSFKVNTRLNRWIDFGNGEKGNLIDLGICYHRCSVSEFLRLLGNEPILTTPQQNAQLPSPPGPTNTSIELKAIKELTDPLLLKYLRSRHIPSKIAMHWCKEIDYVIRDRTYRAIGFPNQSGGYELRNSWFKGSISPKDSSRIQNDGTELAVFEGFFDFLSFLTRQAQLQQPQPTKPEPTPDYLILNSTAFWSKNLTHMLRYDHVHLYLDRDATGQLLTREALDLRPAKFIDHSTAYANYQDLNEHLIRTTTRPRHRPTDHPRQRPSVGP